MTTSIPQFPRDQVLQTSGSLSVSSVPSPPNTPRASLARRARSPRPATATCAGAGGGGLTPPLAVSGRQAHAGPVGPGPGRSPGPWRRGQPPAPRPLGEIHRAPQATHRRQRRDRTRARRPVLVPGDARGLTTHGLLRRPTAVSSAWSDPRHTYEQSPEVRQQRPHGCDARR